MLKVLIRPILKKVKFSLVFLKCFWHEIFFTYNTVNISEDMNGVSNPI